MTPKFDNLASLLMEMPTGVYITDEEKLEIATYIEQFPAVSYEDIADAFEVSIPTVYKIANELDVQRGRGGPNLPRPHQRKLTDAQEKEILDHWLANHHEMTLPELARWTEQQFNVVYNPHASALTRILNRAAAKHGVRLPPPDYGKGRRLKRQRDKHRNEPGSGKLPTQRSQQFKGSTDIVPSEPKHGGPAHPPRSPGE